MLFSLSVIKRQRTGEHTHTHVLAHTNTHTHTHTHIPVVIFQCMGSFVFCPNKPKKRASACENCKAYRRKSAGLCTAMHAPVIWRSVTCICRMPLCICKWTVVRVENQAACAVDTGSFPVVTVTNLFANRSTLNSCNFVVSWRIELKFVALETWRVSFFNNIRFVAKRWGLKNHPRSLLLLLSDLLSSLYWPWDPLSSLESTPVSI